MKKSLIALAALAASGVALAQSSVTLYGVLDTGLTYSKGADSVYGLTKVGGVTNSRLGFRGVEDLGNGLKAFFTLEAGMAVDDGNNYFPGDNGLAFRRTSLVGLEGDFGSVRLGRGLTSSYLAVGRYDVFNDTGIGGTLAWNQGNTGYLPRVDNMVSYTSPVFSGFKFAVDYSFGEQTKARVSRYIGAGLTYDNGPLSLGLGVDQANNTSGAKITGDERDLKTVHVGGGYNFGVAKVTASYKHTKYSSIGGGSSPKLNSALIGVSAPVGGVGEVRASYNYYKVSDSKNKAHQVSLGYVHNLSKRTALYGMYSYVDNNGPARANGLTLSGAFADAGLSNKGAQHGLQMGLRHAF